MKNNFVYEFIAYWIIKTIILWKNIFIITTLNDGGIIKKRFYFKYLGNAITLNRNNKIVAWTYQITKVKIDSVIEYLLWYEEHRMSNL